jgi:hypothetical protein
MKHLSWTLLLCALASACVTDTKFTASTAIEIAPGNAIKVPRVGTSDPVIKVNQPSIVFVMQGDRLRATLLWSHQSSGTITVPLRAVDDGSGKPLIISVKDGPALGQVDSLFYSVACPNCFIDGNPLQPCCPNPQ